MKEKYCLFHSILGSRVDMGNCKDCTIKYEPKTLNEAEAFQAKFNQGFSEGYHRGLQEGYATARFTERCYCCHCRSHGEFCK